MTLQHAESVASSAGGHGLESLNLMDGVLGSDYEQDDILQAPSLESGIFGVLFTLSQEKNQQHIYYHWILLKILLDAWQLFTTIMTPEMGWDIDPDSMVWKCVSVLSFGWLKDLGYTWYVAVLYSMAGLLAVNLVLCVWVAWSFKEQKFDYVWPIKVVRGFSYVFLQVFDITSLNFLQLGISCNYVGPAKPHLHMALFPRYSCSSAPHIIHALVSGLLLLLFAAVAMLVNMSEVDVNPTSKAPQALGHSGAEVTAFGIKALMTLVGVFLGWPKVAAVAYCVLATWLAWEYLRWVPHLLMWVNCLKGGVAFAMFFVAAMQLAVSLLPRSAAHTLTLVMAVGLGPAFLIGALATFLRTRLFTAAVTKAFKAANYELVKPQDIYHFAHPRDVEIAARCARVWTDLYTLEKTAVHRAEEIIKAGVALFPDNAYVALVYANFMLDMLGFSQTGSRQLESVRKLNPSLMCRFMLFVRHQQATQKAASSNVKGGSMDLLGYVEYQRKQRMVLRHHKDALQAMANFWRLLGFSTISFSSLSKSLEEIDTSITQAETAYRVVLELYNNSPRLVRLYARFLETIKQDPWTAAQYHDAAERLEEDKDEDGQGPVLPDGTPISRMDDVEKGVLVVNAFGDIQVANRKLHNMFGYKKGDLDGKNVTALMPPHEAKRHPGLMRRYIDSGDKAAPYFRHPVLGVHRERVAFTVRIAVSRASGLGEDSVFIGLIEALPAEPGTGRVWVTPEGVIVCCDPGFVTCFGYHPDDVIGVQLDKLLRTGGREMDQAILNDVWIASKVKHDNQEYVQKLLASARDYGTVQTHDDDDPTMEANKCSVLHKYDFAKEVHISVRSDMTKSNIYEVRMKLLSDEPQLLMVVERKGTIRHMSGDLAKVLGVGLGDGPPIGRQGGNADGGGQANGDYNIAEDHVMVELMSDGLQRALDDFLPSPWKVIHYKYRKYIKGGAPGLSGAWGCRAVAEESGNAIGPTMQLVGVHGKPVYVHVTVSSRDNQGEVTHVVRMNRSSKDQAIAERRLRLLVSEDGAVHQVLLPGGFHAPGATAGARNDALTELFGFPPEQLLGCQLWDFMSLASQPVPGAARQTPQMQVPYQEQVQDVIAEAEAVVRAGRGYGAALGIDGNGSGSRPQSAKPWADGICMNQRMLDNMITSSLQTPGVSWRVNVVPPSASVEAATMGSPERAAAVLARRTKQGVLKLDVTLPRPGGRPESGHLLVQAELWLADAVTGVLEIDGAGKISGILEEDVRPPGLLFGLPKEDILGSQLGTLLRLLPGQSPVGLLTDSGIAKKSALKASSKKGKIVEKVGPVHYLEGFHRDHQPLHLAVQVVGKPGPGNPVIAIIRFASQKLGAKRPVRPQAISGPGISPGAAAHGGDPSNGPRSHVQMSLTGNESHLARPPSGSSQLPIPHRLSSVNGSYLSSKFREANLFRSGTEPQQQFATARATLKSGGGGISIRTLTRAVQSTDGSRTVPADAATTTRIVGSDGEFARRTLASTISAVSLMPQPARGNSNPNSMATAVTDTPVTTAAVTTEPATLTPLPGAVALATGVASVLSSRSLRQPDRSNDGSRTAAAAPAAAPAAATTASPPLESLGTGSSSPPKPESPPAASPSKRPIASASPRADADLGVLIEQPVRPGGQSGGLTLVTAMKALRESGGNDDQKGVDKWVKSGGQFFKNETQSVMEAELDVDEEEDDDAGSFGATSRATSSHWMSPTGSRNFNDPSEYLVGGGDGRLGGAGELGDGHHHRRGPLMAQAGGTAARGGVDDGGNGWRTHLHPQGFDVTGPDPMGQGPAPWDAPPGLEEGAGNGQLGGLEGTAAEMPPMEEVPDDRSDGGESAYSGISSANGFSDGETPADFQRGKRYRKLVKLMDSPEAQRTVVRMKINTALTLLAASAIHIVCFALVITAIKRQSRALDNMADAGHSQVHLQRLLVEARALDQAYEGMGTNYTYGLDDVQTISSDIMTDCQEFRRINNDLLNKLASDTEALYYGREVKVWSGINATTNASYYEPMSLWDGITRIFVSAKTIFQSHEAWYQQRINISSTLAGAFLFNSGQALIPGMSEVMRTLLYIAVQKTNAVKMLQLTFLIVEGFVVTCISAIVMLYILRSVCDQRYHLYETFLKIPVGLTRALASQTTHLLDDDESDDDEEEDGSQLDNVEDGGPAVTPKRKALFDDGNGGANGQDQGGGGSRSRRGSTGSDTGKLMYGGGGGPPRGNARQRRSSGAMYGSKAIRINDDSTRALLANAAANRAYGGGGGSPPPPSLYQPPLTSTAGLGSLESHHYYLNASVSDRERRNNRRVRGGWFGRLFGGIWRPSNTVIPLPSPLASPGVHDTNSSSSSRRTLERNSRIPQATLIFIFSYSLLIILFYSVSYGMLLGVKDMVALHGVADHNTARAYRTVFYAQELLAEKNITMVPHRVVDLRGASIALRDAYYTLRMGAYASTAIGPDVERFPMIHGHGAVKGTPSMFQLFYSDDTCLRLSPHLPCPADKAYRFYQIIRSGVDGMMTQLLLDLKHLADKAEAAVVNNASQPDFYSPEWDFIYNVGTVDLYDGNQRIMIQHHTDIGKVFKAVVILHVVLFLLLLSVFLGFLIVVYLPLLRRMAKEKRRIAEMMSQLPAELDVMKLVSTALMGPKTQSHHSSHSRHHGGSMSRRIVARSGNSTTAATGGGAPAGGVSGALVLSGDAPPTLAAVGGAAGSSAGDVLATGNKAYHTWKDILNRTTNVNTVITKESVSGALSIRRSAASGQSHPR
ncbi:hypothetical protein Vretimale_11958 [Volvox reticuliferus]|uniref:PAS domain-containing protein n=2 Tax=Volvox reticuliferus TaxID=1737510 RepID=A0A8J4GIU3_9CHLO|nr:hypothetical protein Vretimale_11958 [Volvox reticuliferus]